MSVHAFRLPSFAKINLTLRILGKRDNGFHELCTIFQTVSLKDYLTFSAAETISLTCNDKEIPLGDGNLIVKAAKLLREKFGVKRGAAIHLEKNIPAPGGLGGGSSNAAVALVGLCRLWNIEVKTNELEEIGSSLGSDVPFFFHGGTALGTGRGNEIAEMPDIEPESMLVITSNVAVSTAAAFARINAAHLTKNRSKSILQICCDEANSLRLPQTKLTNDFEIPIFNIEPEIERVKRKLVDYGARQALLSGSGASVFGIFDNQEILQDVCDKLRSETDWRVFPVNTVSRREYREALSII